MEKRHSISLRTKTTLEEKTIQFHQFGITLRQRYGRSLSRLFNMDETPMRFELLSSRTLEFSDSRTVPVKSCGAEKRSFTVTLAVAADGKKLPPSVIFKGVRTPRDLAVSDTVRVSFHKKGWMDEKGNVDNRLAYSQIIIEFRILLSTRNFFLAKTLGYKPNPLPWREFTCSQFNLLEKSLGL